MADIFISFIHEEENLAKAVQHYLWEEFRQLSVPWSIFLSADPSQLLPGQDWLERINQELNTATVVMLMLSQASVKRPWVNFEAGAAWLDGRKHIIPVCYGGILKDQLPTPYAAMRLQGVQLPEDLSSLVWAVSTHLGMRFLPPPHMSQENPGFRQLQEELKRIEDLPPA